MKITCFICLGRCEVIEVLWMMSPDGDRFITTGNVKKCGCCNGHGWYEV